MNNKNENIEQVLEDVTFNDAPDRGHQDLLEQKLLLNFNAAQSRQNSTWRIITTLKPRPLAV